MKRRSLSDGAVLSAMAATLSGAVDAQGRKDAFHPITFLSLREERGHLMAGGAEMADLEKEISAITA